MIVLIEESLLRQYQSDTETEENNVSETTIQTATVQKIHV